MADSESGMFESSQVCAMSIKYWVRVTSRVRTAHRRAHGDLCSTSPSLSSSPVRWSPCRLQWISPCTCQAYGVLRDYSDARAALPVRERTAEN